MKPEERDAHKGQAHHGPRQSCADSVTPYAQSPQNTPGGRGIELCKIAFALPEKIRYNNWYCLKNRIISKKRVALCVKPASGPHAFFF